MLSHVFTLIPEQRRGKKDRKSSKKGHAPEVSKMKSQSSSHREWKRARREEIDPLTVSPEALSPETEEVVAAVKGVVSYSRYADDSLLSQ